MTNIIGKINIGTDVECKLASTSYGTCSTAAATVAKVATMEGFVLLEGITIHIKFTYSNTASNPTLNVNGTGAKKIYRYGTTVPGTSSTTSWYAGSIVSLTYDGTNWIMNDFKADSNTDTKVTQNSATADVWRPLLIGYQNTTEKIEEITSQTNVVYGNAKFQANPSKGELCAPTFVGELNGTADKATCDADGNDITSTYAKKNELTAHLPFRMIVVGVNDDLNTLVETNVAYSWSYSLAPANSPTGINAGVCYVTYLHSQAAYKQQFVFTSNYGGLFFRQQYYNSTTKKVEWNSWNELSTKQWANAQFAPIQKLVTLTNNDDLNTCTDVNTRYTYEWNKNPSNVPVSGSSAYVYVYYNNNQNYIRQIAFVHASIWTRATYWTGAKVDWYPWRKLSTDEDIAEENKRKVLVITTDNLSNYFVNSSSLNDTARENDGIQADKYCLILDKEYDAILFRKVGVRNLYYVLPNKNSYGFNLSSKLEDFTDGYELSIAGDIGYENLHTSDTRPDIDGDTANNYVLLRSESQYASAKCFKHTKFIYWKRYWYNPYGY